MVVRLLALCGIKHAVGDYFSLEVSWPNPIQNLQAYKDLVDQPGVPGQLRQQFRQ